MSQATLKNPKEVLLVAKQVWKYLRKTKAEGLELKAGGKDLEVYTDSSYGPGGLDSQGTVLVLWGKSPIMWKSGRQGAPALSTAESELTEGIDGMIMGDSVDVLILELSQDTYAKVIKIDNTAAVSLMTEAAGSWRTRHLRQGVPSAVEDWTIGLGGGGDLRSGADCRHWDKGPHSSEVRGVEADDGHEAEKR